MCDCSYTDFLHQAYTYLQGGRKGPDYVSDRLKLASKLGLKYARIWAIGDSTLSLHRTPGTCVAERAGLFVPCMVCRLQLCVRSKGSNRESCVRHCYHVCN